MGKQTSPQQGINQAPKQQMEAASQDTCPLRAAGEWSADARGKAAAR